MSCLLSRGAVLRQMADHLGAWQADQEAAELARTSEVGTHWAGRRWAALALDAAALGRTDEALKYIEAGHQAKPGESRHLLALTHAHGTVLLALGRPAAAREIAAALGEQAAVTGVQRYRMPALLLSAAATAALGDAEAAAEAYSLAAKEADGMGRMALLWRALAGLAEMQRVTGRTQESAASARRAWEIINRLVATVPDERLRTVFLQSATAQRVLTLAGG